MPTYHATGTTARLSTCNLQPTLTANILRTMGAECKRENARVQQIFSSARGLMERPIGEDGGANGVVRFIGVHGDMPLFVVEAGESVSGKKDHAHDLEDEDEDADVVIAIRKERARGLLSSNDSPLTSIGDTPTHSANNSSPAKRTEKPRSVDEAPFMSIGHSFANRLASINDSGQQAVVLDVELSQASFLPISPSKLGGKPSYKDLKVEVFLNGELVDLAYVSSRFASSAEPLRFTGTRIHRQVEKPWVYTPSSSSDDAIQRWCAVSSALSREAERRGRNQFGSRSPSGDFLSALGQLELPERLRGNGGLAVFDVVITAGKGQKYGAMTSYIMVPTRMDDPDFVPVQPFSPPARNSVPYYLDAATSVADILGEPTFESYLQKQPAAPEDPLSQSNVHRIAAPSTSPKKTTLELQTELGIAIDTDDVHVAAWEKTSGRSGKGTRTLKQRLGDIGKMSPKNQEKEMARLKLDLGGYENEGRKEDAKKKEDESLIKKKMKLGHVMTSPSPHSRHAFTLRDDPFVDVFMEQDVPMANQEDTMSPLDLFKQWPSHLSGPPAAPAPPPIPIDPALTTDSEAMLTQNRLNLALTAGLPSNGALLRRIAASSPQHTPPRRTLASALAHSPTIVPVKPQRRPGPPKTPTPKRITTVNTALDDQGHNPIFSRHESPLSSFTKVHQPSTKTPRTPKRTDRAGTATPGRSGHGSKRTADAWNPTETTIEESVAGFKAGDVFKGSCVRYAEGEGMQRQIGKARAGEFREGSVVVGMRFVVV